MKIIYGNIIELRMNKEEYSLFIILKLIDSLSLSDRVLYNEISYNNYTNFSLAELSKAFQIWKQGKAEVMVE